MSADLDRQLKVLSGEAERELAEEKLSIAADLQRQKDDRRLSKRVQTMVGGGSGDLLPTCAALSRHEIRNYSIASAISNLMQPKPEKTLEREVSHGIASDLGRVPEHGGLYVPFRISASGLDSKTDSNGAYLTSTKVSGNIVDALRASTRVLQLGASFMGGLRSDFALPVEGNIVSASFVSENPGSDVAESDPSFEQRTLRPHPAQGTITISRQLLAQASPDVESWLRNRIARAHALLLDRTCIHGTGTENQFVGITNTVGVNVVAIGQNGGACTADHINSLEAAIAAANGDSGTLAFLTNSGQRSKLRKIPEMTNGSLPLWRDGSMLDYKAAVSNQVRSDLVKGASGAVCSAVIFGDWSSLIVGEFSGALEVVFDPYSQKRRGLIELSSYAAYDAVLTQAAAFSAITDAI